MPAQMSAETIAYMRSLYATRAYTHAEIARMTGSSPSTVCYHCVTHPDRNPVAWPLQGWEIRAKEIAK